jgi:hypothetical protein
MPIFSEYFQSTVGCIHSSTHMEGRLHFYWLNLIWVNLILLTFVELTVNKNPQMFHMSVVKTVLFLYSWSWGFKYRMFCCFLFVFILLEWAHFRLLRFLQIWLCLLTYQLLFSALGHMYIQSILTKSPHLHILIVIPYNTYHII